MNIIINGSPNMSIQIGDIVYTTIVDSAGTSGVNTFSGNKPIPIGVVTSLAPSNYSGSEGWNSSTWALVIGVDVTGFASVTLTSSSYLFFSKSKAANVSGVLGYYASVEYRNYSKKKAEIFATGTEYAPSSK
tara:strand:+ start:3578 stop:3973 length:396 start_codon:yes stop_codon:yes gene_type:complete